MISNVAVESKMKRLKLCEDMVSQNCVNYENLRLQANRLEEECDNIKKVIYARLSWEQKQPKRGQNDSDS